jgi:hypothetical protein
MDSVTSQTIEFPNWLKTNTFHAEIEVFDKVSRFVNYSNFIFGGYGASSLILGYTGALTTISYLPMALAIRKVVAAIFGYIVYPSALKGLFCLYGDLGKAEQDQIQYLEGEGFIAIQKKMNISGFSYDAILVTHPTIMENGQWTLHALGNSMHKETSVKKIALSNFSCRSNTLILNGPSVALSSGFPTRYQMAAAFEAALQFLECEVKATHIIMKGFSLGVGMLSEAVLMHNIEKFKLRKFLFVSECGFSSLSKIAATWASRAVEPLFIAAGMELDCVEAAKKLSGLEIYQIIIQHTSEDLLGADGTIADNVSLAAVVKPLKLPHKVYLESEWIEHNLPLPLAIQEALNTEIKRFFNDI